jgi:hypothetical protein
VRRWPIRVLVVVAVVFAAMWFTWPWVGSKLTWLVPAEKELHQYLKKAMPVEQELLQAHKNLEDDLEDNSVNREQEHVEEILELSEKLLAVNEHYWVEGKGQPFFQRTMYTIRFVDQPDDFLPNWPGPDDPEGKAMLRELASDTGSLAVYAWGFKEDGNAMARQMIATFGDAPVATTDIIVGTRDIVQRARDSKGRVQYVYKRWKGNYRPPLSLFRTGN